MGGDLNLKKSWHPASFKNQLRTRDVERKALQKREKTEQLGRERAEEAQIQELQEIQEAAGGAKKVDRVEWMYNVPTAQQNGTTEGMESYLLGKRRLDDLIQKQGIARVQDPMADPPSQPVTSMQDVMAKARDDPLLLMKKQEAMLKDPVKMRKIAKDAVHNMYNCGPEEYRKRIYRSHSNADHDHQHRRMKRFS